MPLIFNLIFFGIWFLGLYVENAKIKNYSNGWSLSFFMLIGPLILMFYEIVYGILIARKSQDTFYQIAILYIFVDIVAVYIGYLNGLDINIQGVIAVSIFSFFICLPAIIASEITKKIIMRRKENKSDYNTANTL